MIKEDTYVGGLVGFEGLKVICIIGMLKHERSTPQPLFIDLKVREDFSRCAATDDFALALDYVQLSDFVRKMAIEGEYQLLETFASHALDALAKKFSVEWAWIRLRKPNAIEMASCAVVELSRQWQGARR